MKVVLVANDSSECGTAALNQSADLACTHGAQLVMLTVLPRTLGSGSTSHEITEHARAEHLAGGETEAPLIAEDILAEAKATLAGRDHVKAIYVSRAGRTQRSRGTIATRSPRITIARHRPGVSGP